MGCLTLAAAAHSNACITFNLQQPPGIHIYLSSLVCYNVMFFNRPQAMLQVRSLRHLSGLQQLQELVAKPRGYIK
jgi:hypothetical protein